MKSLLIKLNSDSYVMGPLSLSSLRRITCKFVCFFLIYLTLQKSLSLPIMDQTGNSSGNPSLAQAGLM